MDAKRARCSWCHRTYLVKSGGFLRGHIVGGLGPWRRQTCPGSGESVAAEAIVETPPSEVGRRNHPTNAWDSRQAVRANETRWERERADPSIATERHLKALVARAAYLTDDQRSRLAALLAAPRSPATPD